MTKLSIPSTYLGHDFQDIIFRSFNSFQQLSSIILRAKNRNPGVILWRNGDNGRIVIRGEIVTINDKSRYIEIKIFPTPLITLTSLMQIYFKADHDHLLFKTTISSIKKDIICMEIPEIAYSWEKRLAPRDRVSFSKGIEVKFYINEGAYDEKKYYHGIVLDFSNSGIGLFMNFRKKDIMKKNSKLFITEIASEKLNKEIETKITYNVPTMVKTIDKKIIQGRKLGLDLSVSIPTIAFAKLAK